MNKKTIPQLELELVRLHRRLTMTVKNIDERRALIKKIRMGKVKQPPPKGKKTMLRTPPGQGTPIPDFDDPIPSFGTTPNASFD